MCANGLLVDCADQYNGGGALRPVHHAELGSANRGPTFGARFSPALSFPLPDTRVRRVSVEKNLTTQHTPTHIPTRVYVY